MDIRYSCRGAKNLGGFLDDKHFVQGLMGPFGSGKSSVCVAKLVQLAHEQPVQLDGIRRARFAAIRNTYPQLNDTTLKTVLDWLPEHLFGKYLKAEHTYLITGFGGVEIEIMFRALDRPEHVSNLLSLELTAAWVNEAREVPWAVVQALMGRVGRFPSMRDGGPQNPCVLMDTNPPDTDSWWYRQFEEVKPKDWALFKQPSGLSAEAENKQNLRAGYYESLLSGDASAVKVYVHGEYGFVKDGKPVYPEYNDNLHCQDVEPIEGVTIYRGWDFGLTPACTFSQVFPDGRWVTFDEMTSEELSIDPFADAVIEHTAAKYPWAQKFIDVGDPAGKARSPSAKPTEAQSCFDVLHQKGINIEEGEQTLTIRLGSVKRALNTMMVGKPRLIVHSRCTKLRKGYQGRYQFKRVRITGSEERYHDEPDKNDYSHPHDANQYTAAKIFGAVLKHGEPKKATKIKYPSLGVV